MAAKYFVPIDSSDANRQELEGVNNLAQYMYAASGHVGEFFVNNHNSIKIQYDIQTGAVNPVAVKQNQLTTYVFSVAAFQALLEPVKEAIRLLAKLEMLLELAKCDSEIGKIIKQRHLDENGNAKDVTSQSVHTTLNLILRFVSTAHDRPLFGMFRKPRAEQSPKHQAIYKVLKTVDFDAINSRNDALQLIRSLKDYAEQPQLKHP